MSSLDELTHLIIGKNRVVIVAENLIDLSTGAGENCVYVIQLPITEGVAGGRVGGIGERRMERLYCFRQSKGVWSKVFDSVNVDKLSLFELPYHASGLSIILPDGSETVISGVVDGALVKQYDEGAH